MCGKVSVKSYRTAIDKGIRCLESTRHFELSARRLKVHYLLFAIELAVDLKEGNDNRGPEVTHRKSVCNKIYLDEVLKDVSECAFANNE